MTQESLRAQIGMVTQDTSLLHRSVRDNILYGRPDATEEMMIEAARRAEALDFIAGLADAKGRKGLDAHVGERGVKLSGGQRQRIAIARVMLKDAPILILDEATSALDSEVEAAIQENLYRLMEGKTVIAIAHRLSTIAAMDRLVVMDQGEIIEEGTHDELVAQGRALRTALGAPVGRLPAVRRSRRRRPRDGRDRPGSGVMINEPGFRENLWRRFEGAVDAFHDTDREVLPRDAWRFILYFARQAKGPFALLLVIGGLAGAVDAALYWSIGWLIDLLEFGDAADAVCRALAELAGLLALLLVVRTAVMIGSALVEQQVIVPGFYSMVRWQSFRRVIEQPYDFYQNDFAGRIATKIMQGGEAVGDFIVNVLQTMWSFLTFVVLAITILVLGRPAGWAWWWRSGSAAMPASSGSCCRRCAAPAARPPTNARSSTAAWSTPSPTSCRSSCSTAAGASTPMCATGWRAISRRSCG